MITFLYVYLNEFKSRKPQKYLASKFDMKDNIKKVILAFLKLLNYNRYVIRFSEWTFFLVQVFDFDFFFTIWSFLWEFIDKHGMGLSWFTTFSALLFLATFKSCSDQDKKFWGSHTNDVTFKYEHFLLSLFLPLLKVHKSKGRKQFVVYV
jgi:hypothetical protein